jgi:hypothetical protein
MSQRLCDMMSGNIAVVSEYGEGSTFTIHLPEEMDELDNHSVHMPIHTHTNGPNSPTGNSGHTAFLIDGDPATSEFLGYTLAKEGIDLSLASVARLELRRQNTSTPQ